ncbi:hypothetical protein GCM10017788_08800 [Amycolatopsis acidiphila]|uniref:MEDS domain-containing protein n=2 Tax=Amycolatopsis acidiphila TaxID=715473 RepID=A0A558A687_9PSEU|nr:hypothetical protein FNH06_23000 [Amycolatopsis acidiphila]GHG57311.1 hypothetical protein GCM10017788_08800 [Amycolatopsis acidiphila]
MADARGLAAQDHVCWFYGDRDEFRARAREFLAEGRAAGQRVRYVTADQDEAAGGMDRVEVSLLRDVYPVGGDVDVTEQVRRFAAATDEALRDGFTGLRVAADVTDLVRTPARLAVFGRYEHVFDRFLASRPFTAMCGYDRRTLDGAAVDHLASLHPAGNVAPPFRLYARGCDGFALAGDLDLTGRDLLARALDCADPRPARSSLCVDASAVEFIDHRALITLAEHARTRGFRDLVLHTSLRYPARLVELLGIDGVRIEPAE